MFRRSRTARLLIALAVVALTGCEAPAEPSAAAREAKEEPAAAARGADRPGRVCDLVAMVGGSENASGTRVDPLGSVAALNRELEPGQTGCLREGTFTTQTTKIVTPRIKLRSYPGERATISGRLWVDGRGVDVVGLVLDSSNVPVTSTSPTVTAPNVHFRNDEVTNNHQGGICFGLGSNEGFGWAIGTVIERSRIHDCGQLPPTNHHHGIYVTYARGVVIRHNLIYGNGDRGVQLYPDADGTKVVGNVIDGNGEGVIISGDAEGTSDDNLISRNLITGSVTRWNVESSWPGDLVGSANLVTHNCLFSESENYGVNGGIQPPGRGFTASENLIAEPLYAAPEAGVFLLPEGSPCLRVASGGSPVRADSPPIP